MEPTTFLEHYRICTGEEGREVSRTGAAINYKAIDTRTHERVRLQLIPLATIEPEKREQLKERAETAQQLDHVNIARTLAVGTDHDYFVLVSEYLEGETIDSWVVENGPMAADAALRIGLAVVRALGVAAFFHLTHRAIQPSNLMIVPGESPDGGWPFVKLLNFGLAGLELHSDSNEAPEIAPSISPQFASPEQRLDQEINFESEMYSLGATMCFLLTGAAPLAVRGMKARLRIRRLPELRRAPKPLRNLLVSLLRESSENRPHDPVALERDMRECLTKIERRQAIGRKLGISLATVVARKPKKAKEPTSALTQVLRGFAAVVVVLLATAAAAEYFFHDQIPYLRRTEKIGVPIGVPDKAKFAAVPSPTAIAENQPSQTAGPVVADANQNPPADIEENQTSESPPPASTPAIVANQATSGARPSEPSSPAVEPSEPPSSSTTVAPEDSTRSAQASESTTTRERTTSTATNQRSSSQPPRITRRPSDEDNSDRGQTYQGRGHARIIGRTPDGRPIVKLTSGRVVILPRHYEDNGIYPSRSRRRVYTERPDDFVPPAQPFYPNN
ncbi:MAG: protein kinase [Verrucomicrobia bacterium]|nr:protein kinase [Verrucomicrobiota bacterium]